MVRVQSVSPDATLAERYAERLRRFGVAAEASVPNAPVSEAASGDTVVLLTRPFSAVADELMMLLRHREARILVGARTCDCGDDDCWQLLSGGAYDVVVTDDLVEGARHAAPRLRQWQTLDELLDTHQAALALVGRSRRWRRTMLALVAAACCPDTPILLTGETGTGKEMAARLAHSVIGGMSAKALVIVDCTTIVENLSGSELFGHERGAFTGATAARDGALAAANGGTLFLDEIGELPLSLQAQLLRVIQEGAYRRVGGNSWREIRFRLISATNRDLEVEVGAGRFRRDLFFRIAGAVITLPPLRDRPGDILPLADAFFAEALAEGEQVELSGPVRSYLLRRPYEGNVRDLRQLCRRIANAHAGSTLITAGDIPPETRPRACSGESPVDALAPAVERAIAMGLGLNEIKEAAAEAAIAAATVEADGNLAKAAAALNVTSRALQIRRKKRGR